MANVRINALTTTATSAASDDYFALDGTTNGTRKILGNRFALLSGATFTGGLVSTLGAITTSTPMLSGTQEWTTGATFTGLKLNVTDTASAAGSLLLDLQKGGTSKFYVDKNGGTFATATAGSGLVYGFTNATTTGFGYNGSYVFQIWNGTQVTAVNGSLFNFGGSINLGWAPSGAGTAQDVGLNRNAAGVLEINNGTAGTFRDLTLRSLLPASGTITADTPLISGTQTWNNAGVNFTALKLNVTNTASGASSNLLDLQVGGVSKVKVDKDGFLTAGFVNAGARVVFGGGSGGIYYNGSSMNLAGYPVETDQNFWLRNSSAFFIIGGSSSPQLTWDANYTIGQRNGTNAQLYKLYNTYTSGTSYERLGLNWATNVAQIYTEKGSGGGTARDLVLGTNATTAITISGTTQATSFAAVTVLKNYTVGTLPTASSYTYGMAFVSDAMQTAGTFIGTAPTGGGSVVRAVYSDGTNWLLL